MGWEEDSPWSEAQAQETQLEWEDLDGLKVKRWRNTSHTHTDWEKVEGSVFIADTRTDTIIVGKVGATR